MAGTNRLSYDGSRNLSFGLADNPAQCRTGIVSRAANREFVRIVECTAVRSQQTPDHCGESGIESDVAQVKPTTSRARFMRDRTQERRPGRMSWTLSAGSAASGRIRCHAGKEP